MEKIYKFTTEETKDKIPKGKDKSKNSTRFDKYISYKVNNSRSSIYSSSTSKNDKARSIDRELLSGLIEKPKID